MSAFYGSNGVPPLPVATSVRTLEGTYVYSKNYTLQQVPLNPARSTRLSVVNVSGNPAIDQVSAADGVAEDKFYLLYNVGDTVYLFEYDTEPVKYRAQFVKRLRFHENPTVHDVCSLTLGQRAARALTAFSAKRSAHQESTPPQDASPASSKQESSMGPETAQKTETTSSPHQEDVSLPEVSTIRENNVTTAASESSSSVHIPRRPNVLPSLGAVIGFLSGDLLYCELPGRNRQRQFNERGTFNNSKVVGVRWIPRSSTLFVAWHEDGMCVLYSTEHVDHSLPPKLPKIVREPYRVSSMTIRSGDLNPLAVWYFGTETVRDLVFSPSGDTMAVVVGPLCFYCELIKAELPRPRLLCIYRSWVGGLNSVAFSPNSSFIALGGEADTISFVDLERRAFVAYGTGHVSWISRIVFDSHRVSPELLRIFSTSFDTSFISWEFRVMAETDTDDAGDDGKSEDENPKESEEEKIRVIMHPHPSKLQQLLPNASPKHCHVEPLSDCVVTADSIITSCSGGHVKVWTRPPEGLRDTGASLECLSASEDDEDLNAEDSFVMDENSRAWEDMCEREWGPKKKSDEERQKEGGEDKALGGDVVQEVRNDMEPEVPEPTAESGPAPAEKEDQRVKIERSSDCEDREGDDGREALSQHSSESLVSSPES